VAILLTECRGAACWLTINRPEQQNAVNWELFPLIEAAIAEALADASVQAIVLTGAGTRHFCAGGDLAADLARSERGLAPQWLTHPLQRLFETVERCPLPIVARVNGHCVGPGMSLLAMCDLAVAADTAKFALGEAKMGLVPGLALGYLQRLVPKRRLLEWMLCAEPFDAGEALAAGLVNHVAPAAELDAKLDWLLARLAGKSPDAQRRAKRAFKSMEDMALGEAFAHGASAAALSLLTADFREAMRAAAEKRVAAWRPRPEEK
jgi:enoyl-CoA hydratase/carnithine racemase